MKKYVSIKVLAVMLILSLVFSGVLFGCSKDSEDAESKTKSEDVESKTKQEETDKETKVDKKDEEPTEISVAIWEVTQVGGDKWGDYLQDKLNVKITPITLDWSNFNEKIQLMGATDELPDLISSYTVHQGQRFFTWIEDGLTRPIPDELVDKYKYAKPVFEDFNILNMVKDMTGEYYFIPRPFLANKPYDASQHGVYYRKDWMEKVGVSKVPETMPELYALLEKFVKEDPDDDGIANTYGLTGNYMALYYCFGAQPDFWVEDDNGYIPGFMSNQMIDALEYFRKMYNNRILDPELTTTVHAREKFAQNNFGALISNADPEWVHRIITNIYGLANPQVEDPLDVIGLMGPFSEDADSKKMWSPLIQMCGTEVAYHVSDEKLDKILGVYNFLLSPEGKELSRWGFEGIDYVNQNGTYKRIFEGRLREKYPSQIFYIFSDWDGDWHNDASGKGNPNIPVEYRELGINHWEDKNPYAADVRLDVSYAYTPSKVKFAVDWNERMTQIIVGDEDIDSMFKDFIDYCYEQGAQDAIDEVNEKFGK